MDELGKKRIQKKITQLQNDYYRVLSQLDREETTYLFLESWKQAVTMAGPELFHVTCDKVENATDKDQLKPKLSAVRHYIDREDNNRGLFVAILYTFYKGEQGQLILESRFDERNLGDLAVRLNLEQLTIVTQLMFYHVG